METAYEFNFPSSKELGKILTSYCKTGGGFMLSFLERSIMILPTERSTMYDNVMVEVPYSNMPGVGYVDLDSNLMSSTIYVKTDVSPVSPSPSSNGMVGFSADISECEIRMCVDQMRGYGSSTFNVSNKWTNSVIESPFLDEESTLVTTIHNGWLDETLKNINNKAAWSFVCNEDSISFIFKDRVETYPDNIDIEPTVQGSYEVVDKNIIAMLKKIVGCKKDGITKVRVVGNECWFVTIIGHWGVCMIRMSCNVGEGQNNS